MAQIKEHLDEYAKEVAGAMRPLEKSDYDFEKLGWKQEAPIFPPASVAQHLYKYLMVECYVSTTQYFELVHYFGAAFAAARYPEIVRVLKEIGVPHE